MSLKTRLQAIASAFGEAFTCLGLALRDSLRPGILLRSSGLCLLAFGVWSWVFYSYFEQIGTLAGWISFVVIYGGAAALGLIPSLAGGSGGSMGGMGGALAMLILYVAALTLVMLVTLYAGVIVLSIRLALPWLLMDALRSRSLRHYPALAARTPASSELLRGLRYRLGPWLGITAGLLLCLLIPLVNGLLVLILLAYLNVRFLLPSALSRLASGAEQLAAIKQQRGALAAFGLLIFLLTLVPVLNLLLPALLAGGACHLAYRGLDRSHRPAGVTPAPQVSLPAG